jgi:hypothetical protein
VLGKPTEINMVQVLKTEVGFSDSFLDLLLIVFRDWREGKKELFTPTEYLHYWVPVTYRYHLIYQQKPKVTVITFTEEEPEAQCKA